MTKGEIETIRNIIARLKSERLGAATGYCGGFDDDKSRIYLDTWIIGPLELLLPGMHRDVRLAASMSRK